MKSQEIAFVALFATLTAIGAFIHIPLPLVPITLQTFFVLLSGLVLGKRLGALSQLCYVGMGAVGLPVFAGGTSGLGIIAGPTGGYIVGFVFAAYIAGAIMEGGKTIISKFTNKHNVVLIDIAALMAGIVTIYAIGILQLMNFTGMGLYAALKVGVIPFIAGDVIKAGLAFSVARKIRKSGVLLFYP
ncbi:MAG: biotin transporter BioY [Candidatus Methanofastidiosia archaeon]